MNYVLIIALLLSCGVQAIEKTVVPSTKEQVNKLVGVLKSNAPLKDKMDACRLLSIVGTEDAVAPLASLLGDERLSHMARYGLEPIPEPAVDAAFRDSLTRVKGRQLVGVIGSIGLRRDAEAVEPLKELLMRDGTNPEAMGAAMRALGQIGTKSAAEVLKMSLEHAPPAGMPEVYEGLFRCAERLASEGYREDAIEIYDILRGRDASHQVRAGALRGAILVRGNAGNVARRPGETTETYLKRRNDGVALIMEHMRSDDYIMFSAAVQAAQELKGAMVTRALTAELDELPADNQILVIHTLGERGDAAALPALFKLARGGDESVRIAVIECFAQIGDASAVPVLVELLKSGDSDIRETAQESLAAIAGDKVDAAVIDMLNSEQTSQRLIGLDLVSRRMMTSSIGALLKAARDDDRRIRVSALRKIGEMGSLSELPELLGMLEEFRRSEDLEAVERALSAICMKAENPESHTPKLIRLMGRVQPMQKRALLHVLSVIGGTEALEAVRGEVNGSQEVVRDAAIRALCSWKTTDAAPYLLSLAKESPFSSRKTSCLRGYISLIRAEGLSKEKKLDMCKEAAKLIQRSEEKKLLLGVLGAIPSADALSMAATYLNDPLVRNEASFATVAIAEKIVQASPDAVADAMEKVLQATKNRNVTRRARAVLKKAR
jgi:HEAT repeat protein